jgi:hypothetical protein
MMVLLHRVRDFIATQTGCHKRKLKALSEWTMLLFFWKAFWGEERKLEVDSCGIGIAFLKGFWSWFLQVLERVEAESWMRTHELETTKVVDEQHRLQKRFRKPVPGLRPKACLKAFAVDAYKLVFIEHSIKFSWIIQIPL